MSYINYKDKILIEKILKYKEDLPRILSVLGVVRIATSGQLFRLVAALSEEEREALSDPVVESNRYERVMATAETMMNVHGFLNKVAAFELPKHLNSKVTDVWFLTPVGAAKAYVIDPIFVRFNKGGNPVGRRRERISHELLVTESFLKLAEKNTICDFYPEEELRRRLMKRRHELLRQGINPKWNKETAGEETGDFKAILLNNEMPEAPAFEIEGEAAGNYRRREIEVKPDKMVWFTGSKAQKEVVIGVKGKDAVAIWVLDDVTRKSINRLASAVENGKSTRKYQGYSRLENRLLSFLRDHRSAFTVAAAARMMGTQQAPIRVSVGNLEEKGSIKSISAKLQPGMVKGRPAKLFWYQKHSELSVEQRSDKIRFLVISATIEYMANANFIFRGFIEAERIMEFRHLEGEKMGVIRVVIDSTEVTDAFLISKINLAKKLGSAGKTEVVIATSTFERYEEIKLAREVKRVFIAEQKRTVYEK